jgi:hypothetical protein
VFLAFCVKALMSMEPLLLAVQLPGAPVSEAACEAAKQQLQQLQVKVPPSNVAMLMQVLESAKEYGQLDIPGND